MTRDEIPLPDPALYLKSEEKPVLTDTCGWLLLLPLLLGEGMTYEFLKSSVQPLRHRIALLVQNETEKLAASLFDRSLRVHDLIAARASGFDNNHNAVNARGQHRRVSRFMQRPTINQDVVETDAQGID